MGIVNNLVVLPFFGSQILDGGKLIQWNQECAVIIQMNKQDRTIEKLNGFDFWKRLNNDAHFLMAFTG